jgi:hypothetical protein
MVGSFCIQKSGQVVKFDTVQLMVGTGATRQGPGLSGLEAQSHFAVWSVLKAPLLISANVSGLDAGTLALLQHKELLALNQDKLGAQAMANFSGYSSQWYMGSRWDYGRSVSTSTFSALMLSCGSNSQPLFTFNGSASSAGALVSQSIDMCLAPLYCGSAPGTPVVLQQCEYVSSCNQWQYDTFTTFTFTSQSGLLLQDNGLGAAPTIQSSSGSPNQQWMFTGSGSQIGNAGSGNCVTAPDGLMQFYGPLSTGAVVVAFLNRGQVPYAGIAINFAAYGLPSNVPILVHDVWAQKDLGRFTGSFPVPSLPAKTTAVYTLQQ